MRKYLVGVLLLVTLLASLLPTNVLALESTILVPIGNKIQGDMVTISGKSSLDEVNIKVVQPDHTVLLVEAEKVEKKTFSYIFQLPQGAAIGRYTVVAGEGENVDKDTFLVITEEQKVTTIDSINNKAPGEEVAISGESTLEEVNIKIMRPNGTVLYVDVVRTSDGKYSKTFTLPLDAVAGQYTAVVGEGEDVVTGRFSVSKHEIPKSSNANLSELTIGNVLLTPAFDPEICNYEAIVPNRIDMIEVVAKVANKKATIKLNSQGIESENPPSVLLEVGKNEIHVEVTAEDGTKNIYSITLTRRDSISIPEEIKDDIILEKEISSDNEAIEIPEIKDEAIEKVTVKLVVPENVENPSIITTPKQVGSKKEVILPKTQVSLQAKVNGLTGLELTIPAGVKITGSNSWNGIIKLPKVIEKDSVSVEKGTINTVIEVGLENSDLEFDLPVRMVIPGEAGNSVGFIKSDGIIHEITYPLSADIQEVANDELTGDKKEGKVDHGNNLAIWTKHFTKFLTYTKETENPSSGEETDEENTESNGNKDGKRRSSNEDQKFEGEFVSLKGGVIKKYGITVEVPAGVINRSFRMEISKYNLSGIKLPPNSVLVSGVVNITKDINNDFEKPVKITIPYEQTKVDTNKFDLGIYWYDEKEKSWKALDHTTVDTKALKVTGAVHYLGKFAILGIPKEEKIPIIAPSINLTDIKGHWAEEMIIDMVNEGITKGYPDGTFKPNDTITRGEFTVFVVRAFHLQSQSVKTFADIADHWARKEIEIAATNEVINGYNRNNFGPNDQITREQMAAIVARVMQLKERNESLGFTDEDQISDWAIGVVAAVTKKEIMKGYPDQTFRPKNNATRAEALTVLYNAIK